MNKIYLFLLCIILVGCCSQTDINRADIKNGKATLVAYRVAKHSHMWLKIKETNTIHDISGLGGRRIPTINLGDTIDVKYYIGYT